MAESIRKIEVHAKLAELAEAVGEVSFIKKPGGGNPQVRFGEAY